MPITEKELPITTEQQEFFWQFYEENRRLIFYFTRKLSVSDSDRDDLVQDVLLRLLGHVATLQLIADSRNKVACYISATVRSAYSDLVKAKSRVPTALPEEKLNALQEEQEAAREQFEAIPRLDVQYIKQCLPEKEWKLLVGKYLIGYSDQELGDVYGCSQDSVRMALTRAKRKARKILAERPEERGESHGQ